MGDSEGNDAWYPSANPERIHWDSYESYLRERGWPNKSVASLDRATDEILSKLANPSTSPERRTGLVVGYVQSPGTDVLVGISQEGPDSSFDFDHTLPEEWDLGTQSAEHSTDRPPLQKKISLRSSIGQADLTTESPRTTRIHEIVRGLCRARDQIRTGIPFEVCDLSYSSLADRSRLPLPLAA